ncbi:MAG: amidase [Thiotrichales bacterium]|nr:amidase [Thiotrichales bacterium]
MSPTECCERILRRIAERNPQVNAFSQVLTETARDEARRLGRGPAGGAAPAVLTVAVKDNIDTVPAICDAGLARNAGYRPTRDAEVVARLRRAGMVIVGVTRTDSGAFGVTTPPVANSVLPDRIAGGSSGGSAAAVAAGLCDAAIGTDTGGSVRIPAACCGVFGFKPTRGAVSLEGVRPLTRSCDHVGALASSVRPLSSIMRVIAPQFDRLPAGDREPVAIGIPRPSILDAAPEILADLRTFEEAMAQRLTSTDVPFPAFDELTAMHIALSMREAAEIHGGLSDDDLASLPEVARESILIGRAVSRREHEDALRCRRDLTQQIEHLFEGVDFLLLPTLPVLPPLRGDRQVRIGSVDTDILHALIRYTAPFNQTGHPALAFPWRSGGGRLPVSLQLVAPRNADRRLLSFATAHLPRAPMG